MRPRDRAPQPGRIEVAQLVRTVRQPARRPGLSGALRHVVAPRFEQTVAVDRIDLAIAPGESVGYVGANGAGKSTTVKLLAGVIERTSGELRVNGLDPARERQRNAREIGVVWGQRQQLWWDLPLRESYRALRDIYAIEQRRFRDNLDGLVELLELAPLMATPVRQLSLGQSTRANICAALLHDPAVLFLDEPTIGLDVLVKERVREALRRVRKEHGTTLLLTSHDLGDVEQLCDRLVILDRGRILHDGPLREAIEQLAPKRVLRVTTHGPVEGGLLARELGLDVEQPEPHQLIVRFGPDQAPAELVAAVLRRYAVADLTLEPPSIEDVVRRVAAGAPSAAPV